MNEPGGSTNVSSTAAMPANLWQPTSFTSVRELTDTIGAFIDSWNDHPTPFAWTKDAEEILASIKRAKTKTNALTKH